LQLPRVHSPIPSSTQAGLKYIIVKVALNILSQHTSAPTRINSRQKSQFELNCFFENAIRVEYELIQIARNSIQIHSNGIRIDSNEITKNSKNYFFQLGKQYYTKTSIILTVLIICSRISLKSTGFSDYSIIIEYLFV
jgi:hypothetical protein